MPPDAQWPRGVGFSEGWGMTQTRQAGRGKGGTALQNLLKTNGGQAYINKRRRGECSYWKFVSFTCFSFGNCDVVMLVIRFTPSNRARTLKLPCRIAKRASLIALK